MNIIAKKFGIKFISLIVLLIVATLIFSFINADQTSYYLFSDGWNKGLSVKLIGEENGSSILMDDASKEFPFEGDKCVRISTDNSELWKGFVLEYKGEVSDSVGGTSEYIDLSNYDKLEFYAKADTKLEAPYAIMEVGVGEGKGYKEKRTRNYIEIGQMWERYILDLKGMELHKIKRPVYMKLSQGTVYLDEIRFVKTIKK